ncbi:hypothetical protein JR316_0008763 [Psilocybe cubensis]|uniref:Uncharacterized protein n=2 Tax=Psilocybe cubensis TaxID=181762 RepID=A0ACB8GTJ3_PSICU|nr:hypothetical protein JR316_0008763 [Psilocybe cubensis]KAH9478310.1 hypothetical protein JR316_0008763 [Psilocybe cubensis]
MNDLLSASVETHRLGRHSCTSTNRLLEQLLHTTTVYTAESVVRGNSAMVHTPPVVCTRCCLTANCAFIHNIDSIPKCLSRLCDACADLLALNEQIDAVQQQLDSLLRRRQEVKSRVNRQHDQLTNRLPLDIVAEIFHLVAGSVELPEEKEAWGIPNLFPTAGPLLLGVVCKCWRDITLGLPRLWATVCIEIGDLSNIQPVEQWLQRSSKAPLDILVSSDGCLDSKEYTSIKKLWNLLRPHATRWNRFSFLGRWEYFYDLFHNLDSILQLDTLEISITGMETWDLPPIKLERPLGPRNLFIDNVSLSQVPLQFANLTYLHMDTIQLGEILHIICHAPNLTKCIIGIQDEVIEPLDSGMHYPLPSGPIVHRSLKFVEMDLDTEDLLVHLTLPSLETFECECYSSPETLDKIAEFMARSAPTLNKFLFNASQGPLPPLWYERLGGITHLCLYLYGDPENESIGCDFLRALTDTSANAVLPHLQEINIGTFDMSDLLWSKLCEAVIARGKCASIIQDDVGDGYAQALGSVWVHVMYDDIVRALHQISQPDVASSIERIRASGVRFEVVDKNNIDMVFCASRLVVNSLLPFSRELTFPFY